MLWDVNTLAALTTLDSTVKTAALAIPESVYSLAISPSGNIIVCGSPEKVINVWDFRSGQKCMMLRGHSDTVKALVLNKDATQFLSGSADHTICLWSLGEQRCITTIKVHDDSVWALEANESFTCVYSGGRDKKIYQMELRKPEKGVWIAEETAPVLKILLSPDGKSIWVSTTDSTIKKWSVDEGNGHSDGCDASPHKLPPLLQQPDEIIEGNPSIRHYAVLNDKRHVLTKDINDHVTLWDILKASKVEDLGTVNFEDEVKNRFKQVYVPNWFTVDIKCGLLTIELDKKKCFAAWVLAKDFQLVPSDSPDVEVNLGSLVLQALFENWQATYENKDGCENESSHGGVGDKHMTNGARCIPGNLYFSIPKHTPMIFSGIQNCTLLRLLVGEAHWEKENLLLHEVVPQWITEVLVSKNKPSFSEIEFFLYPYGPSRVTPLLKKKPPLCFKDTVKVRNIVEYVYKRILSVGSDAGSQTACQSGRSGSQGMTEEERKKERASVAVDKVELLCRGQVLDHNMDLRTVQHFIWKGFGLILNYRRIQ